MRRRRSRASFSVRLNTKPFAEVTVAFAVQNSQRLYLAESSRNLTFTSLNWATPQSLFVEAKTIAEAERESEFLLLNVTGEERAVDGVVGFRTALREWSGAVAVTVTSFDNAYQYDGGRIQPSSSGGSRLTEGGEPPLYGENALRFAPLGVGGGGVPSLKLRLRYRGVTSRPALVVAVPASGRITIAEGGGYTYTVRLQSKPSAAVLVSIMCDAPHMLRMLRGRADAPTGFDAVAAQHASPLESPSADTQAAQGTYRGVAYTGEEGHAQNVTHLKIKPPPATIFLTFDQSNWQEAQMVSVYAIDDAVDAGVRYTVRLTHTASSLDPAYDSGADTAGGRERGYGGQHRLHGGGGALRDIGGGGDETWGVESVPQQETRASNAGLAFAPSLHYTREKWAEMNAEGNVASWFQRIRSGHSLLQRGVVEVTVLDNDEAGVTVGWLASSQLQQLPSGAVTGADFVRGSTVLSVTEGHGTNFVPVALNARPYGAVQVRMPPPPRSTAYEGRHTDGVWNSYASRNLGSFGRSLALAPNSQSTRTRSKTWIGPLPQRSLAAAAAVLNEVVRERRVVWDFFSGGVHDPSEWRTPKHVPVRSLWDHVDEREGEGFFTHASADDSSPFVIIAARGGWGAALAPALSNVGRLNETDRKQPYAAPLLPTLPWSAARMHTRDIDEESVGISSLSHSARWPEDRLAPRETARMAEGGGRAFMLVVMLSRPARPVAVQLEAEGDRIRLQGPQRSGSSGSNDNAQWWSTPTVYFDSTNWSTPVRVAVFAPENVVADWPKNAKFQVGFTAVRNVDHRPSHVSIPVRPSSSVRIAAVDNDRPQIVPVIPPAAICEGVICDDFAWGGMGAYLPEGNEGGGGFDVIINTRPRRDVSLRVDERNGNWTSRMYLERPHCGGNPIPAPGPNTPTRTPTSAPTWAPSAFPSVAPSTAPSSAPSGAPTTAPTIFRNTTSPSRSPSSAPTSTAPTIVNTTHVSTSAPSTSPSTSPTSAPTAAPSVAPTRFAPPRDEAPGIEHFFDAPPQQYGSGRRCYDEYAFVADARGFAWKTPVRVRLRSLRDEREQHAGRDNRTVSLSIGNGTRGTVNAQDGWIGSGATRSSLAELSEATGRKYAGDGADDRWRKERGTISHGDENYATYGGTLQSGANDLFPTPIPTVAPTFAPTSTTPTATPSLAPTSAPSFSPTSTPSKRPTMQNETYTPSGAPTAAPTSVPSTSAPSFSPSGMPTAAPTETPTRAPSAAPTVAPTTAAPSVRRRRQLLQGDVTNRTSTSRQLRQVILRIPNRRRLLFNSSSAPTSAPSTSAAPTSAPSEVPSGFSSSAATKNPTASNYTYAPTSTPSMVPSTAPSATPSATALATFAPSTGPSASPTFAPSTMPSSVPTKAPTAQNYTYTPTSVPSHSPTASPSAPSMTPSSTPSAMPSVAPSFAPSSMPSIAPTKAPTVENVTYGPSVAPTHAPTATPSAEPSTTVPTLSPTVPTAMPSIAPSAAPTGAPSSYPSSAPTDSSIPRTPPHMVKEEGPPFFPGVRDFWSDRSFEQYALMPVKHSLVSVGLVESDAAGIDVDWAAATVEHRGSAWTFRVRLTSRPWATVRVNISESTPLLRSTPPDACSVCGDGTSATFSLQFDPNVIVFVPDAWRDWHTVHVITGGVGVGGVRAGQNALTDTVKAGISLRVTSVAQVDGSVHSAARGRGDSYTSTDGSFDAPDRWESHARSGGGCALSSLDAFDRGNVIEMGMGGSGARDKICRDAGYDGITYPGDTAPRIIATVLPSPALEWIDKKFAPTQSLRWGVGDSNGEPLLSRESSGVDWYEGIAPASSQYPPGGSTEPYVYTFEANPPLPPHARGSAQWLDPNTNLIALLSAAGDAGDSQQHLPWKGKSAQEAANRAGAAWAAEGGYAAPAVVDLDGDGAFDVVVGAGTDTNRSGLTFFRNRVNDAVAHGWRTIPDPQGNSFTYNLHSPYTWLDESLLRRRTTTAGQTHVTNGMLPFDLVNASASPFAGSWYAHVGTADALPTPQRAVPTFGDLDFDGDFDCIVGTQDGALRYLENIGSVHRPRFIERPRWDRRNPVGALRFGMNSNAAPTLADFDKDGDLDLLVGKSDGSVHYFMNVPNRSDLDSPSRWHDIGGRSNNASANPFAFMGVDVMATHSRDPRSGASVGYATPTAADIDNDGDYDVVVGSGGGFIAYYENVGFAHLVTGITEWSGNNSLYVANPQSETKWIESRVNTTRFPNLYTAVFAPTTRASSGTTVLPPVIDRSIAWAGGGWRTLVRTVNGGADWTPLELCCATTRGRDGTVNYTSSHLAQDESLLSLAAASPNDLWAIGESGIGLRSFDGGDSWVLKSRHDQFEGSMERIAPLHAISIAPCVGEHGCCSSNVRSSAGPMCGEWEGMSARYRPLNPHVGVGSKWEYTVGWAVGSDALIVRITADGYADGNRASPNDWSVVLSRWFTPIYDGYSTLSMSVSPFSNPPSGTLTPEEDQCCREKRCACSSTAFLGVHTPTLSTAFVCGEAGVALRTTDAGKHWAVLNTTVQNTDVVLRAISSTTNGGEGPVSRSVPPYMGADIAYNVRVVWVVGSRGTILLSTNGGNTFARRDKMPRHVLAAQLRSTAPNRWFEILSSDDIVAVSAYSDKDAVVLIQRTVGSTARTHVLRTENGGRTWIERTSVKGHLNAIALAYLNTSRVEFDDVTGIDPGTASTFTAPDFALLAVGDRGTIANSTGLHGGGQDQHRGGDARGVISTVTSDEMRRAEWYSWKDLANASVTTWEWVQDDPNCNETTQKDRARRSEYDRGDSQLNSGLFDDDGLGDRRLFNGSACGPISRAIHALIVREFAQFRCGTRHDCQLRAAFWAPLGPPRNDAAAQINGTTLDDNRGTVAQHFVLNESDSSHTATPTHGPTMQPTLAPTDDTNPFLRTHEAAANATRAVWAWNANATWSYLTPDASLMARDCALLDESWSNATLGASHANLTTPWVAAMVAHYELLLRNITDAGGTFHAINTLTATPTSAPSVAPTALSVNFTATTATRTNAPTSAPTSHPTTSPTLAPSRAPTPEHDFTVSPPPDTAVRGGVEFMLALLHKLVGLNEQTRLGAVVPKITPHDPTAWYDVYLVTTTKTTTKFRPGYGATGWDHYWPINVTVERRLALPIDETTRLALPPPETRDAASTWGFGVGNARWLRREHNRSYVPNLNVSSSDVRCNGSWVPRSRKYAAVNTRWTHEWRVATTFAPAVTRESADAASGGSSVNHIVGVDAGKWDEGGYIALSFTDCRMAGGPRWWGDTNASRARDWVHPDDPRDLNDNSVIDAEEDEREWIGDSTTGGWRFNQTKRNYSGYARASAATPVWSRALHPPPSAPHCDGVAWGVYGSRDGRLRLIKTSGVADDGWADTPEPTFMPTAAPSSVPTGLAASHGEWQLPQWGNAGDAGIGRGSATSGAAGSASWWFDPHAPPGFAEAWLNTPGVIALHGRRFGKSRSASLLVRFAGLNAQEDGAVEDDGAHSGTERRNVGRRVCAATLWVNSSLVLCALAGADPHARADLAEAVTIGKGGNDGYDQISQGDEAYLMRDKPLVFAVDPNRLPTTGGLRLRIIGANFGGFQAWLSSSLSVNESRRNGRGHTRTNGSSDASHPHDSTWSLDNDDVEHGASDEAFRSFQSDALAAANRSMHDDGASNGVFIGGVRCTDARMLSNWQITCRSPPGAGRNKMVIVRLNGVNNSIMNALGARVDYIAPTISSVHGCDDNTSVYVKSETVGCPTLGGSLIAIRGRNLVSGRYRDWYPNPWRDEVPHITVDGVECAAHSQIGVGDSNHNRSRDAQSAASWTDLFTTSRYGRGIAHDIVWCWLPPGLGRRVRVGITLGGQHDVRQLLSYAVPSVEAPSMRLAWRRSAAGGDAVTVNGSYFGATAAIAKRGAVTVWIGAPPGRNGAGDANISAVRGRRCAATVWKSDRELTCIVPPLNPNEGSARELELHVVAAGQSGSSGVMFEQRLSSLHNRPNATGPMLTRRLLDSLLCTRVPCNYGIAVNDAFSEAEHRYFTAYAHARGVETPLGALLTGLGFDLTQLELLHTDSTRGRETPLGDYGVRGTVALNGVVDAPHSALVSRAEHLRTALAEPVLFENVLKGVGFSSGWGGDQDDVNGADNLTLLVIPDSLRVVESSARFDGALETIKVGSGVSTGSTIAGKLHIDGTQPLVVEQLGAIRSALHSGALLDDIRTRGLNLTTLRLAGGQHTRLCDSTGSFLSLRDQAVHCGLKPAGNAAFNGVLRLDGSIEKSKWEVTALRESVKQQRWGLSGGIGEVGGGEGIIYQTQKVLPYQTVPPDVSLEKIECISLIDIRSTEGDGSAALGKDEHITNFDGAEYDTAGTFRLQGYVEPGQLRVQLGRTLLHAVQNGTLRDNLTRSSSIANLSITIPSIKDPSGRPHFDLNRLYLLNGLPPSTQGPVNEPLTAGFLPRDDPFGAASNAYAILESAPFEDAIALNIHGAKDVYVCASNWADPYGKSTFTCNGHPERWDPIGQAWDGGCRSTSMASPSIGDRSRCVDAKCSGPSEGGGALFTNWPNPEGVGKRTKDTLLCTAGNLEKNGNTDNTRGVCNHANTRVQNGVGTKLSMPSSMCSALVGTCRVEGSVHPSESMGKCRTSDDCEAMPMPRKSTNDRSYRCMGSESAIVTTLRIEGYVQHSTMQRNQLIAALGAATTVAWDAAKASTALTVRSGSAFTNGTRAHLAEHNRFKVVVSYAPPSRPWLLEYVAAAAGDVLWPSSLVQHWVFNVSNLSAAIVHVTPDVSNAGALLVTLDQRELPAAARVDYRGAEIVTVERVSATGRGSAVPGGSYDELVLSAPLQWRRNAEEVVVRLSRHAEEPTETRAGWLGLGGPEQHGECDPAVYLHSVASYVTPTLGASPCSLLSQLRYRGVGVKAVRLATNPSSSATGNDDGVHVYDGDESRVHIAADGQRIYTNVSGTSIRTTLSIVGFAQTSGDWQLAQLREATSPNSLNSSLAAALHNKEIAITAMRMHSLQQVGGFRTKGVLAIGGNTDPISLAQSFKAVFNENLDPSNPRGLKFALNEQGLNVTALALTAGSSVDIASGATVSDEGVGMNASASAVGASLELDGWVPRFVAQLDRFQKSYADGSLRAKLLNLLGVSEIVLPTPVVASGDASILGTLQLVGASRPLADWQQQAIANAVVSGKVRSILVDDLGQDIADRSFETVSLFVNRNGSVVENPSLVAGPGTGPYPDDGKTYDPSHQVRASVIINGYVSAPAFWQIDRLREGIADGTLHWACRTLSNYYGSYNGVSLNISTIYLAEWKQLTPHAMEATITVHGAYNRDSTVDLDATNFELGYAPHVDYSVTNFNLSHANRPNLNVLRMALADTIGVLDAQLKLIRIEEGSVWGWPDNRTSDMTDPDVLDLWKKLNSAKKTYTSGPMLGDYVYNDVTYNLYREQLLEIYYERPWERLPLPKPRGINITFITNTMPAAVNSSSYLTGHRPKGSQTGQESWNAINPLTGERLYPNKVDGDSYADGSPSVEGQAPPAITNWAVLGPQQRYVGDEKYYRSGVQTSIRIDRSSIDSTWNASVLDTPAGQALLGREFFLGFYDQNVFSGSEARGPVYRGAAHEGFVGSDTSSRGALLSRDDPFWADHGLTNFGAFEQGACFSIIMITSLYD